MKSIKKQLLTSILTLMFLGGLVTIVTTYFELKHEMDELFDENMVQVAHSIAVHDFSADAHPFQLNVDERAHLKGEEEFLVQIWQGRNLTYSSLPALDIPYQGAGGVHTILHDGQEWRYYGLAQNDWLIQISQPIPVRHSVIFEIYWETLIPTLLQLPVLAGLIVFFVTRGFTPLAQISASIQQRNPAFLDTIPDDNVPQEVSAMVAALNDLLGRLDNAIKTQRRFTADAAHELRTPLTAVTLQLDILRRAKTKGEREDAIAELYKGVERSTHLVKQLLELARQEPDELRSINEPCNLTEIITDVVERHNALATHKDIDIIVTADEACRIKGDKNAIDIMIGNLLNNAILYTQAGGKVDIALSKTDNGVSLCVKDNGPGIPDAEQPYIFNRFYRIAGSCVNGSGLGLSIVRTIADRHHAALSFTAGDDGVGSIFTVVFKDNFSS